MEYPSVHKGKKSPWGYAADGNIDGLKTIQASKAKAADEDGNTILHEAAREGKLEMVKFILKQKFSKDMLNVPNAEGSYPLHLAAYFNHHKVLRALIEAGAKLDVRGRHIETPLHTACRMNAMECIEILLANNADRLLCNEFKQRPIEVVTSVQARTLFQRNEVNYDD